VVTCSCSPCLLTNQTKKKKKKKARAVRRHDEFEFLSDIIPEKVPVKKAIENKKAIEATLKTSSSSAAAAQATQDPVPDLDDQS